MAEHLRNNANVRVETPMNLAAVVFLRSASGRSVRDLATGPLPSDLESYRPPQHAIEAVRRAFENRGFHVFSDAHQLTLTLEGERSLFVSCFGVLPETLDSPIELQPPDDVRPLVEAITLLRRPVFTTTLDEDAFTTGSETAGLTGSTLGRFAIGARLGAGGMGEVYRAEDTQLKRTVAIKRLAPRLRDRKGSGNELLREARRSSALNHARIASVYDVFVVGNELFLVMEYIDGTTLRERLESPMPVAEFCRIAVQCTDALAAAHQKGILHGDLKPTNIMLTHDGGDVKVCDFGLARRLAPGASHPETTSTAREGLAGTPAYMAPESFLEGPIDARADIFSLGVVFYEILSGRNPFLADSLISTVDRIRTVAPEPLDRVNPSVPVGLARVVQRMIDKDPLNRYASASDLGRELSSIQVQLPLGPPSRRPVGKALWIGLICVLALTVLTVPLIMNWRRGAGPSVSTPLDLNVAILPFTSTGGDGDKQFFVQGLTEMLTQQLSRLTVNRKLQVATVADIRARNVTSPTEAREQLGANMVLTGSLQYSGNDVRITCLLVDTRTGRPVRREVITADASNPMVVQDRVLEAGVGMMGLDLAEHERTALMGHETQQPGAHDFYLQARGYLADFDRIENIDNAVAVFRKALDVDPRYALAYAGLGEAYWRKHELTGSAVWVDPARAACEGALGIDPSLAEPHACLGMVLNGTGEYEKAVIEFSKAVNREPTNDLSYLGLATAYERLGRPEEAERTFRRAIQLRPHYWGGYNTLGAYYYRLGRFDEALTMFQQVAALAPDNVRAHSSLGAIYFMTDRPKEAEAAFGKSLAIRPNYVAASNLGTLYFFEGEYRRSAEAFRQALALDQSNYQVWANLASALEWARQADESAAAYERARELVQERLSVNPRDATLHMALANYNAALGDTAKGRASLDEVLRLAPADAYTLFQIAEFYEWRLKQRDEALTWLGKAVEQGQTWREVDRSPFLGDLRRDPRFQQLRRAR